LEAKGLCLEEDDFIEFNSGLGSGRWERKETTGFILSTTTDSIPFPDTPG
jgi:hypothetical protein